RPPRGIEASAAGRIVDPHARVADGAPRRESVAKEIALDRGGEDRTLPLEDRRDRESRRLAGLGRSDHDHRLARLGSGGAPVAPAQRQPAGLRCVDAQRSKIARARPPSTGFAFGSGPRAVSQNEQHCRGYWNEQGGERRVERRRSWYRVTFREGPRGGRIVDVRAEA